LSTLLHSDVMTKTEQQQSVSEVSSEFFLEFMKRFTKLQNGPVLFSSLAMQTRALNLVEKKIDTDLDSMMTSRQKVKDLYAIAKHLGPRSPNLCQAVLKCFSTHESTDFPFYDRAIAVTSAPKYLAEGAEADRMYEFILSKIDEFNIHHDWLVAQYILVLNTMPKSRMRDERIEKFMRLLDASNMQRSQFFVILNLY
jgi:hypothetical protein